MNCFQNCHINQLKHYNQWPHEDGFISLLKRFVHVNVQQQNSPHIKNKKCNFGDVEMLFSTLKSCIV